jgi:putative Holliday junction resolvase
MKLLGIDHGSKRIGLAICDSLGMFARELMIIRRTSDDEFARIQQIAAQEGAEGIVIGVPTNYEAHPGQQSQADEVRQWIDRLSRIVNLPLVLWDEQLSSADARDLARSKRRKPSEPIDDLAARVILQSYLDAVRDGLAKLPEN